MFYPFVRYCVLTYGGKTTKFRVFFFGRSTDVALSGRLPLDSRSRANPHCYSLRFDLSVKFLVPPFRILETT